MITKESIEKYAQSQGGLTHATFIARKEVLAHRDNAKLSWGYLDRRLSFLAENEQKFPHEKMQRVMFVIENYSIESLMTEISQYTKQRSNQGGLDCISFRLGTATAKMIMNLITPKSERLTDEESESFAVGMTLIALWDAAS